MTLPLREELTSITRDQYIVQLTLVMWHPHRLACSKQSSNGDVDGIVYTVSRVQVPLLI